MPQTGRWESQHHKQTAYGHRLRPHHPAKEKAKRQETQRARKWRPGTNRRLVIRDLRRSRSRLKQAIEEPKPGERRIRSRAPVGSRHKLKTTRNQSLCHQLAGGCHSTGNQPRMGTGSGHSVRPTQETANRLLAQGEDLRGKRPTLRNRLEVGGVCRAWDTRTLSSARRLRTSKMGKDQK